MSEQNNRLLGWANSVIVTIDPQTILDTLAYDITPKQKERLLVLDYAFLIRQQQMGMEVDFPPLGKAIKEQLGIKALKRIVTKAWKRHAEWVRGLGEQE